MSVSQFKLECCPLDLSLKIAFGDHKATHYQKFSDRLNLAWTEVEGYTPFMTPMTAETIEPLVRDWLKNEAVYGREPDIDGHCGRSWFIFNEAWGQVDGKWQVFAAIEPFWAEYHK
jgi:hypothetical protein